MGMAETYSRFAPATATFKVYWKQAWWVPIFETWAALCAYYGRPISEERFNQIRSRGITTKSWPSALERVSDGR